MNTTRSFGGKWVGPSVTQKVPWNWFENENEGESQVGTAAAVGLENNHHQGEEQASHGETGKDKRNSVSCVGGRGAGKGRE